MRISSGPSSKALHFVWRNYMHAQSLKPILHSLPFGKCALYSITDSLVNCFNFIYLYCILLHPVLTVAYRKMISFVNCWPIWLNWKWSALSIPSWVRWALDFWLVYVWAFGNRVTSSPNCAKWSAFSCQTNVYTNNVWQKWRIGNGRALASPDGINFDFNQPIIMNNWTIRALVYYV